MCEFVLSQARGEEKKKDNFGSDFQSTNMADGNTTSSSNIVSAPQQQQQQQQGKYVNRNIEGKLKHRNIITSECIRLSGHNSGGDQLLSNTGPIGIIANSIIGVSIPPTTLLNANSTRKPKNSSFQITSVTVGTSRMSADNGDDSADDLDESHTDDNSRITDLENETPSYSEDTSYSKEDVFFSSHAIGTAPVIPTSSQYGLAIVAPDIGGLGGQTISDVHVISSDAGINIVGGKLGDGDMKDHRNERFKVVKIESTEPFKRGRWTCMDYLDHTTLQPTTNVSNNTSNSNKDGTADSGVGMSDTTTDLDNQTGDSPQKIVQTEIHIPHMINNINLLAGQSAPGGCYPLSASTSPGQTMSQPLSMGTATANGISQQISNEMLNIVATSHPSNNTNNSQPMSLANPLTLNNNNNNNNSNNSNMSSNITSGQSVVHSLPQQQLQQALGQVNQQQVQLPHPPPSVSQTTSLQTQSLMDNNSTPHTGNTTTIIPSNSNSDVQQQGQSQPAQFFVQTNAGPPSSAVHHLQGQTLPAGLLGLVQGHHAVGAQVNMPTNQQPHQQPQQAMSLGHNMSQHHHLDQIMPTSNFMQQHSHNSSNSNSGAVTTHQNAPHDIAQAPNQTIAAQVGPSSAAVSLSQVPIDSSGFVQSSGANFINASSSSAASGGIGISGLANNNSVSVPAGNVSSVTSVFNSGVNVDELGTSGIQSTNVMSPASAAGTAPASGATDVYPAGSNEVVEGAAALVLPSNQPNVQLSGLAPLVIAGNEEGQAAEDSERYVVFLCRYIQIIIINRKHITKPYTF